MQAHTPNVCVAKAITNSPIPGFKTGPEIATHRLRKQRKAVEWSAVLTEKAAVKKVNGRRHAYA